MGLFSTHKIHLRKLLFLRLGPFSSLLFDLRTDKCIYCHRHKQRLHLYQRSAMEFQPTRSCKDRTSHIFDLSNEWKSPWLWFDLWTKLMNGLLKHKAYQIFFPWPASLYHREKLCSENLVWCSHRLSKYLQTLFGLILNTKGFRRCYDCQNLNSSFWDLRYRYWLPSIKNCEVLKQKNQI